MLISTPLFSWFTSQCIASSYRPWINHMPLTLPSSIPPSHISPNPFSLLSSPPSLPPSLPHYLSLLYSFLFPHFTHHYIHLFIISSTHIPYITNCRRVGLIGRLPHELGELDQLRVLSMGNNQLCGEVQTINANDFWNVSWSVVEDLQVHYKEAVKLLSFTFSHLFPSFLLTLVLSLCNLHYPPSQIASSVSGQFEASSENSIAPEQTHRTGTSTTFLRPAFLSPFFLLFTEIFLPLSL